MLFYKIFLFQQSGGHCVQRCVMLCASLVEGIVIWRTFCKIFWIWTSGSGEMLFYRYSYFYLWWPFYMAKWNHLCSFGSGLWGTVLRNYFMGEIPFNDFFLFSSGDHFARRTRPSTHIIFWHFTGISPINFHSNKLLDSKLHIRVCEVFAWLSNYVYKLYIICWLFSKLFFFIQESHQSVNWFVSRSGPT